MSREKKYWKSEIQLDQNNGLDHLEHNEFVEKIPVDNNIFSDENINDVSANRRDFLKYLGFSTSAAVLASCEGPVHKSVPYVIQPERIRPGIANYYATSLFDGFDSANVLVKTREGRPIKIESNKMSKALVMLMQEFMLLYYLFMMPIEYKVQKFQVNILTGIQ